MRAVFLNKYTYFKTFVLLALVSVAFLSGCSEPDSPIREQQIIPYISALLNGQKFYSKSINGVYSDDTLTGCKVSAATTVGVGVGTLSLTWLGTKSATGGFNYQGRPAAIISYTETKTNPYTLEAPFCRATINVTENNNNRISGNFEAVLARKKTTGEGYDTLTIQSGKMEYLLVK